MEQSEVGTQMPGRRTRAVLAGLLVVLATILAVAGSLTLYARQEIVRSSAFADRAVNAAKQPGLQHVIAREIAVQVIEPSAPDAIAARPVITTAVRIAVGSKQFTPLIRIAAQHGHRLLFERHAGNAVFDLADAATVVSSALRTLAPKLARKIPSHTDVVLLALRKRSFAVQTLRFADTVRALGIVLPLVALILYALALYVAPNRRRTVTWAAIAVGVIGLLVVAVFEFARRYVISHLYGSQELNNSEVRAAARALWGAYLGDLLTWTLVVTAVAWLLAAVSAAVLPPYPAAEGLRRARGLIRWPTAGRARTVASTGLLIVGVVIIADSSLAVRVLTFVAGCIVVYFAFGELLTATVPATGRRHLRPHVPRRRPLAVMAAASAAIAAALIVAFAFTGAARRARASDTLTCNGYAQLCDRRLDEAVFAGTHNSMSAADTPGWLIANQDRDAAEQLQDGIRLFKVSTHYAVKNPTGGIYTDIAAEGARLNRVAAKLPLAARVALQRVSRSLARGSARGPRDIWLCHTLCELGATRFVDFLTTLRQFLERNPNQVMILFDEDYVSEADLQRAFQRAKVFNRLAVLTPGQPLPTLGDLIRAKRNIVVFAQKETSGKYAWNHFAFDWIQDTPLGAKKPKQFTCKTNRGGTNDPLVMLNNWADIFPPRPTPNVPLLKRAFLLSRARQCVEQRGRVVNLILTDYYNRGDVVKTVAELNGVTNVPPAAVQDPP
jgi:hypothetical protein